MYDAVDAAEDVLSRELGVKSDSTVESCCMGGLPAITSSGVTAGVSADGDAEGTSGSSGVSLALERGLVVEGC